MMQLMHKNNGLRDIEMFINRVIFPFEKSVVRTNSNPFEQVSGKRLSIGPGESLQCENHPGKLPLEANWCVDYFFAETSDKSTILCIPGFPCAVMRPTPFSRRY